MFLSSPIGRLLRLALVLPLYAGLIGVLEGTMSFCVFHASRGTYDLHEKNWGPMGKSTSRIEIELEEWKRLDRKKARRMHIEAAALASILALLLYLA